MYDSQLCISNIYIYIYIWRVFPRKILEILVYVPKTNDGVPERSATINSFPASIFPST